MTQLITNGKVTLEVTFDGYTENFGLLGGKLHSLLVRGTNLTDKQKMIDDIIRRSSHGPVWARDRKPLATDGRRMGPIERSRFQEVAV